jgi:hypothetical protein
MMRSFDRFVAVDWSGARGAYDGIAVAECELGEAAPVLVHPSGRRWRREEFFTWMKDQGQGDRSLLVGIDCAFALPHSASQAMLKGAHDAISLWRYIDRNCDDQRDFYAGDFAARPDHAPFFWAAGKRPEGFIEHRRATEGACQRARLGVPESPLKLIGARQVGKGGLAGMRVLARLRDTLAEDFAVWPFHEMGAARIVCVELYPRLFLRRAKHGNGKVRSLQALDRCLAALGSEPYPDRRSVPTDHEADALVAAAGLRLIAKEDAVWNPEGLDALARRAEGWIFGVP